MHGELKGAIAKVLRAAKDNEKSSGIYCTSGDQAREYADQGFNMVSPCRPQFLVNLAETCHEWAVDARDHAVLTCQCNV